MRDTILVNKASSLIFTICYNSQGAMQELRSGISAAEQAADHALQARDVARAAMEQHKGAVEAMREQQAQQEAQHQLQVAHLCENNIKLRFPLACALQGA
eukprot:86055-Pelagomonas_calceolata.AAC.14